MRPAEDFLYPSNLSEVQGFFHGQCVFLTGASGLVGRVLLEKLLRCCPGIAMVYVHLRVKRGLEPRQRLAKILDLELFRHVAETLPDYRQKVQVIEGDITQTRLGMSSEDYEKIIENVAIVIHSAASIKFTDTLRNAVKNNVIPVLNIIEMCHKMPRLKAMVHVSTAYVKRDRDGHVLEEIPTSKVTPLQLIDALGWMDDKCVKCVSEFLITENSNSYIITKALAEALISETRKDLPVAIVRPAYIGPTANEPFPGWSDSFQGITGLMLAASKGVLRTIRITKSFRLNLIPVDIVANTIITSAWHTGITKPNSLFIINCAMEFEKLPTYEIVYYLKEKRKQYPIASFFRYPDMTIYFSDFPYYIHAIIDQYIPALIIDFFLYIFLRKTVLVKIYYKIHVLYNIFYNFAKDPWICHLNNYKMLRSKLSIKDSKIFSMDLDNFNWEVYLDACLREGRKYIVHEEPSNLPYAKKKANIWWTVTTTIKWMLILYFFYYVFISFFS